MKRTSSLFAVLVFIAGAFGIYQAKAQELSFSTGETLSHFMSVCLKKEDAVEIVNAHKSSGKEAAEVVWIGKAGCGNTDVIGPKVGKVAYAAKIEGGVFSVVEIVHEGKVVGYFMTTSPVNKPQRNS